MGCRTRQILSWLLLLGAIVLGMLFGLGIFNPPSAAAAIRELEESSGQVVYQSRQTLKDQHGNTWQAIAFQRFRPDGQTSLNLRLVGFPGTVNLERDRPLILTDSLGKTLTAADNSSHIFTDETAPPQLHVGQYDLQPIVPKLQTEIPLTLTLPTQDREAVWLSVAPTVLQEWQAIANRA
jgi:hypothetical protein